MMLLCLATAFASPQLDCGPRSSVPQNILEVAGPFASTYSFGQLQLEGDLLVGSLPHDPATGDRVLFLHRRSAATGDWLEPETMTASDLGASSFAGAYYDIDFAVAGATVFLPVNTPTGSHVAAIEYVGGQWIKVAELQGEPGWGYSSSYQSTGYGPTVWLAADGDRLVVGAPSVTLQNGSVFGALVTYERTAAGDWALINVTEGAGAYRGGPRVVDLDGDRLAVVLSGDPRRAAVLELTAAGWGDTWTSDPLDSYSSVTLDGPRVVVGSYYGAIVDVYQVTAGASLTGGSPIQTIVPDHEVVTPPSSSSAAPDYNPPYSAYVEAGSGFAVIGIEDNYFGYPTVRTLEWLDGAYRQVDSTRAPAGAVDVALSDGEAVWLGPARTSTSDEVTQTRFEAWRIDDGRAVPFCEGAADLLLSGSGIAPFNDASASIYAVEPASMVLLFGGLSMGQTPLSMGEELCIDSAGLVRLGAPMLAGSEGALRVPSSALELEELAPGLVAGGTFFMQGVYREPLAQGGVTGTTNAVRTTLCQ